MVDVGSEAPVPRAVDAESYRGRRIGAQGGDAVLALRWMAQVAGLKPAEIAERMGVSRQAVQQYFQKQRKNPSVDLLGRVARVCGCEVRVVQR